MSVFVKRLTLSLCASYHGIDPNYRATQRISKFGEIITDPNDPMVREGKDLKEEFIFKVGDLITSSLSSSSIYVVEALLGLGCFGYVLRCMDVDTRKTYAIKVLKNHKNIVKHAHLEKTFLSKIKQIDPFGLHHIIDLREEFEFLGHQCLVMELLGEDLYTLLKTINFRGFPLSYVSVITRQILECCVLLNKMSLIHSDLKPENILVDKFLPHVKIIDFGSAININPSGSNNSGNKRVYMQSRYYRAPEIMSWKSYNTAIDVWSVGCISVELFLGQPLFPGNSEYDQVCKITQLLGPFPPSIVLNSGNFSTNYVQDKECLNGYRLMTIEEKSQSTPNFKIPKQYAHVKRTLFDTLQSHANNAYSMVEITCFAHFISQLLQLDPVKRLTAWQALQHPFITGQSFSDKWVPPAHHNQ